MSDDKYAARNTDNIMHTSVLADIVSTVTEVAAFAALVTFAPEVLCVGVIGGLLIGTTLSLTGIDKKMSDALTAFGNLVSPPTVDGQITSGSDNVLINDRKAARAAGKVPPLPPPQPQTPFNFMDIASELWGYAVQKIEALPETIEQSILDLPREITQVPESLWNSAKEMWHPTEADKDPAASSADLDTVSCQRHTEPQWLAEGSSSVFINDQPAVRGGDRITCGGKVSSDVSKNVIIGGEPIVVRTIMSGKTPGLDLAAKVAMILLSAGKAMSSNLPCLGSSLLSSLVSDLVVNAALSSHHPVHAASGVKFLNDELELDCVLPGNQPLSWQRRYNSLSLYDGMLGRGWMTPFDTRVSCVGDQACWYDEQGRELRFTLPADNLAHPYPNEGVIVRRGERGDLLIIDDDYQQWRLFRPLPGQPNVLRLSLLSDNYANALVCQYDDQQRLVQVDDELAAINLHLCYDDPHFPGRVTSLQQQRDNQRWELVSYAYSDGGQLCRVTDASGIITREFAYNHDGLMTRHAQASGLVCEYRWQQFDHWRVVAQRTSAGDSRSIDYDLDAGLTRVAESDGTEHLHYWNADGMVTRYVDARGETWCFDWDDLRHLTAFTDPQGNQTRYQYDPRGNLICEENALGQAQRNEWLSHCSLPVMESDASGNSTRYYYDPCHALQSVVDALGQTTQYRRDDWGRIIEETDPRGGTRTYRYNHAGQVIAMRDCSGFETLYQYHPLGWLSCVTAPDGERTHYEYDAAGRPLSVSRVHDWQEQLSWDKRGLPVRYLSADGKTRHFRHDSLGRLTQTINPAGDSVRREYNAASQLVALINENGERYQFGYLPGGLLAEETGLDGIKTTYQYDACGRTVQRTFAAGNPQSFSHLFRYDAAGQLHEKQTPDGMTRYQYSKTGQLTQAARYPWQGEQLAAEADSRVAFAYDALGRLLSETADEGKLDYQYDELGNLSTLTLPDGHALKSFYYGSGHLLSMAMDDQLITDFSRDSLHREISRSQGALNSYRQYDRLGRLTQRDTFRGTQRRPCTPLTSRDWLYDYGNQLIQDVADQQLSAQRIWHYDPAGKLLSQSGSAPGAERYYYDAAGNPLDDDIPLQHIPHNRVTNYNGYRYRYDIFGRTIEKQGKSQHWHYRYNGEQQLSEVRCRALNQPQHEVIVTFRYDPLGRRIRKTSQRVTLGGDIRGQQRETRFIWQGLRLLQEITPDGTPLTYVYSDQGSYEPLARIEGKQQRDIVYYHCLPNGMPEQVTDAEGTLCWQGNSNSWGKQLWERSDIDGQLQYEQNLRLQGQYLDRETGLHYNLFRYYDPDCGRFTQHDPIGLAGGINLYQYGPNPLTWIDPLGLTPWEFGKFNEWFNAASVQDIIDNKTSVSAALRGSGGKHELFPVSLAAKAKELGFSAEELKRYAVSTDRITFTNVTDSKGLPVPDGGHHSSRAGRHFHNKLIAELEGATSKADAKKIIAKHHKGHMKLNRC